MYWIGCLTISPWECDLKMLDPNLLPTTSYVLNSWWQILLVGFGGGISGDLIGIWAARHTGKIPTYVHRPFFWICVFGGGVAGGLLALAYGHPQQTFLVINIGISAPLILQGLSAGVPKRRRPRVDTGVPSTGA